MQFETSATAPDEGAKTGPNPRKVFVVCGRNTAIRDAMFALLRALRLDPIEWSEAVAMTHQAAPPISAILTAAFSAAQAVVVLLTPDDIGRLRHPFLQKDDERWDKEATGQARLNVIFEAGMALATQQDRTVLVQFGDVRKFTDVDGLHILRFDGSDTRRNDLATRLGTAGCPVDKSGNDWLSAGTSNRQMRRPRSSQILIPPSRPPVGQRVAPECLRHYATGSRGISHGGTIFAAWVAPPRNAVTPCWWKHRRKLPH